MIYSIAEGVVTKTQRNMFNEYVLTINHLK